VVTEETGTSNVNTSNHQQSSANVRQFHLEFSSTSSRGLRYGELRLNWFFVGFQFLEVLQSPRFVWVHLPQNFGVLAAPVQFLSSKIPPADQHGSTCSVCDDLDGSSMDIGEYLLRFLSIGTHSNQA